MSVVREGKRMLCNECANGYDTSYEIVLLQVSLQCRGPRGFERYLLWLLTFLKFSISSRFRSNFFFKLVNLPPVKITELNCTELPSPHGHVYTIEPPFFVNINANANEITQEIDSLRWTWTTMYSSSTRLSLCFGNQTPFFALCIPWMLRHVTLRILYG